MTNVANPITFGKTGIDLLPVIEKIQPVYGRIAKSGLFEERGSTTNVSIFEIVEQTQSKMTKLTSRTERDAVAVSRGVTKFVTVAGKTVKKTGGVHVEDFANLNTGSVFNLKNETVQSLLAKRTEELYQSYAQEKEYFLLTASQGRMRDPLTGAVAIDMFTNTGTVQSTATINASPTSTTLISGLNALRNQIGVLNGYNGVVSTIELVVAEDVFNAIVVHPEFVTAAQIAFTGMGQAAMNNPMFTGQASAPTLTQYGWREELRWQNFLIVTYPQKFKRMDDTEASAVANGKGWTIVHGATNCYEVQYAPAPYFSTINTVGKEIYARSTGIVDDTKIDVTIETHLTPIMKRPELAVDVTFTLV